MQAWGSRLKPLLQERGGPAGSAQRSRIATTPMPPAVQIDTRQRPPPRCCSSFAAAAPMHATVAAKGLPVASEEPSLLSFAGAHLATSAATPKRASDGTLLPPTPHRPTH